MQARYTVISAPGEAQSRLNTGLAMPAQTAGTVWRRQRAVQVRYTRACVTTRVMRPCKGQASSCLWRWSHLAPPSPAQQHFLVLRSRLCGWVVGAAVRALHRLSPSRAYESAGWRVVHYISDFTHPCGAQRRPAPVSTGVVWPPTGIRGKLCGVAWTAQPRWLMQKRLT
jgi:hypothetical protein